MKNWYQFCVTLNTRSANQIRTHYYSNTYAEPMTEKKQKMAENMMVPGRC